MALSDTEIVFIAVASCGAILLAGFISCLLIFCCFKQKRRTEKPYREPSYKSRPGMPDGRAKFLDYERRVFKPPLSSTGSSSYHKNIDNRSDRSEGIYSTPYDMRKLPPPVIDYMPLERERNFGPFPHSVKSEYSDRPSLIIRENTVFIPYTPRFIDMYPDEKPYSRSSYPRLSIKEIDDDIVDMGDEWKYPSRFSKVDLPRYELEYL